jgi:hypothetical protein
MSLSGWEALYLNAQMPKEREVPEDPRFMTDHELRWALRESIAVMYRHLGLDEFSHQAAHHLGIESLGEE